MPFANAGASGVSLFFALSGFLITTLLLREEAANTTICLKKFYTRRALRIFPLYYAVLGLYAVLVLIHEHNAAGRLFWHNCPYYLTYTSNWFVDLIVNADGQRRVIFIFAWSLATEEQFYLVWPPLLRYCGRRTAIGVLAGLTTFGLLVTLAYGSQEEPSSAVERWIRIAQSPSAEIFVGVLLALALDSPAGFSILWRVLGHKASAPVWAIIAIGAVLWPMGVSVGWRVASGVTFAFLIGSCVIRENHGLPLLRCKLLARVGVVSYGMYLLHMISINLMRTALSRLGVENPSLTFAMSVAVTYLIAEASYRIYETPFLRLKNKLCGGKLDRATNASAQAAVDASKGIA
jgi:peptidoglycan/LPS O-acetylase OafA/YrhL